MTGELGPMEDRVANGVRYLNLMYPRWFDAIDLDRLNMWSLQDCVRGQIDPHMPVSYRPDLGFDLTFTRGSGESYPQLTNEWAKAIQELRQ